MTYRQIEQARETRQWITQIIFPAFIGGLIIYNDPQSRSFVSKKWKQLKSKLNSRKRKGLK